MPQAISENRPLVDASTYRTGARDMGFTNRLGPTMENFREVHNRTNEFMNKTALNNHTTSGPLTAN